MSPVDLSALHCLLTPWSSPEKGLWERCRCGLVFCRHDAITMTNRYVPVNIFSGHARGRILLCGHWSDGESNGESAFGTVGRNQGQDTVMA